LKSDASAGRSGPNSGVAKSRPTANTACRASVSPGLPGVSRSSPIRPARPADRCEPPPPQVGCVRRAPMHLICAAPAPSPGRSDQGFNPRNRLPTGSDLGGHTACRGGQRCNNGTKREWCPASLAVPGSPRRLGRTETLT
jgi:hypothetical protein